MRSLRPTAWVLMMAALACASAASLCLQAVQAVTITATPMPAARCPQVRLPREFDPDVPASVAQSLGPVPRLVLALGSRRREELKRLLDAGENPNICIGGGSVLSLVASKGDLVTMDLLLGHGALPDVPRDANGGTPLMMAAGMGRFDAAQRLLVHGADAAASNDFGSTVLHELAIAFVPPESPQRVLQLALAAEALRRGAPVNALTLRNSSSALMLVARGGNPALANLLLAHGADASLRNQRGESAHDIALQKGHAELAKVLIAAQGQGPAPVATAVSAAQESR